MGAEKQADSLDEERGCHWYGNCRSDREGQKNKLPALRNVPKKKLLEMTAKVDKVLSKFKTHSITKTNELFYTGAVIVTNRLGVKNDKIAGRKEPTWKRRLQNKIKELRKELSQLESQKDKERLERKYSIRVKRLNVVNKELKQDYCYSSKRQKVSGMGSSYRQNRLRFYQKHYQTVTVSL